MVFHDLLRDGQPDAGTGIDLLRVQPLEDHEHLVGELGVDADAVVPAGDLPLLVVGTARGELYPGRGVGPAELDRVADQVADQRGEQRLLTAYHRQVRPGDPATRLRQGHPPPGPPPPYHPVENRLRGTGWWP